MYMFIVREVNKSIAKTLAWCHSQSTVVGIFAYRNIKIECLVFPYFIILLTVLIWKQLKSCRRSPVEERWSKVTKISYQPVKYCGLFWNRVTFYKQMIFLRQRGEGVFSLARKFKESICFLGHYITIAAPHIWVDWYSIAWLWQITFLANAV